MTLTPYAVEQFGGLNLSPDPFEIGASGAVDLLNVTLDQGRVLTYPPVAAWATATRAVQRLFTHGTGIQVLAAEGDGTNTTLEAFNSSGTSLATTTYASASIIPHGFASVGTPTASRTYAVRQGDTARRWDGSAWSSVAAIPTGSCAATHDAGTRLAVANTSTNPHRVSFSAIGDPETYAVNDFVDIAPGDGESIVALVSWQGNLFAFKNSKFAVFYSTSTDSDGEPVFNYRMVEGKGIGLKGINYASGAACATRDGVYFVADDGVYVTTGGAPVLTSKAITPLWPGQSAHPLTTIPQLSLSGALSIGAVRDSVYLSAPGSASQMTLVLRNGEWTYLNVQTNSTNTSGANVVDMRGFGIVALANSAVIKRVDFTDQANSALSWSWRSGRYALSDPGRVACTLESSVVGSGTVAMSLTTDLYGTIAGPGATLGTAPATAEGWPMTDQEGTWFQHTLSGTGAAVVNRLTHHVASVKPPGVR